MNKPRTWLITLAFVLIATVALANVATSLPTPMASSDLSNIITNPNNPMQQATWQMMARSAAPAILLAQQRAECPPPTNAMRPEVCTCPYGPNNVGGCNCPLGEPGCVPAYHTPSAGTASNKAAEANQPLKSSSQKTAPASTNTQRVTVKRQ